VGHIIGSIPRYLDKLQLAAGYTSGYSLIFITVPKTAELIANSHYLVMFDLARPPMFRSREKAPFGRITHMIDNRGVFACKVVVSYACR
jgi:hypothetical protein